MTFVLLSGSRELLRMLYSPENHSFSFDEKEIQLKPEDAPSLRAFVDASVVEVIVGERIAYTKRFYLVSDRAPDLTVSVEGGSTATLKAWTIKPVSPNRLTTPSMG